MYTLDITLVLHIGLHLSDKQLTQNYNYIAKAKIHIYIGVPTGLQI